METARPGLLCGNVVDLVVLRPGRTQPIEGSLAAALQQPPFRRVTARSGSGALPSEDINIAIVGAGPVGLLVAVALRKRGFSKLRVFDREPKPPEPDAAIWGDAERSYNLGIGERGQRALKRFGVFEAVDRWSQTVLGRMSYSQDGKPPVATLANKRVASRIIARDRLSSCLYEELRGTWPDVQVQFSVECSDAVFQSASGSATLTMQQCGSLKPAETDTQNRPTIEPDSDGEECLVAEEGPFNVEADVVIGADGVSSKVREAMEMAGSRTYRRILQDRSPVIYKTLPISMPAGSRSDLNYSSRKSSIGIEALPNMEGSLAGVVLFKPTDKDIVNMRTASDAKQFFTSTFPDWPTPQLSDAELDAFALRKVRRLPQFTYCGPSLHLSGGRAVLLGDAIHSVKPYFGLGVNSGFEDVSVLDDCIEEAGGDLERAFESYSKRRGPDARALVESQYRLDQPGKFRTLLFFVGPLLLDTFCNRLLPSVFAPSTLRLLGNADYSFSEIRMRKRRDRALQLLLLGALPVLAVRAARAMLLLLHH